MIRITGIVELHREFPPNRLGHIILIKQLDVHDVLQVCVLIGVEVQDVINGLKFFHALSSAFNRPNADGSNYGRCLQQLSGTFTNPLDVHAPPNHFHRHCHLQRLSIYESGLEGDCWQLRLPSGELLHTSFLCQLLIINFLLILILILILCTAKNQILQILLALL